MSNRSLALALTAILSIGLVASACGSGTHRSDSTTTTSTASGPTSTSAVLPPVIVTPSMAMTTGTEAVPPIAVGRTVAFAMGTIAEGEDIVAISSDPTIFLVTSKGTNNGTVIINAGGRAMGEGSVDVSIHRMRGTTDTPLGTYRLVISK